MDKGVLLWDVGDPNISNIYFKDMTTPNYSLSVKEMLRTPDFHSLIQDGIYIRAIPLS